MRYYSKCAALGYLFFHWKLTICSFSLFCVSANFHLISNLFPSSSDCLVQVCPTGGIQATCSLQVVNVQLVVSHLTTTPPTSLPAAAISASGFWASSYGFHFLPLPQRVVQCRKLKVSPRLLLCTALCAVVWHPHCAAFSGEESWGGVYSRGCMLQWWECTYLVQHWGGGGGGHAHHCLMQPQGMLFLGT